MTIQIVLIEDHELVRAGLRLLIERQPDIRVIGEAADGAEGLKMITRIRPDLVILDLSIPHLNGFELLEQLQHQREPPKVLVLTANEDVESIRKSLGLGASGHLLKRSAADELIGAIRQIAQGDRVVPHGYQISAASDSAFESPTMVQRLEILSEREEEVLRLIAAGYMAKEVAVRLDISLKTVDTYKARGMQKLNIRGRSELVRYSVRQGWLNE